MIDNISYAIENLKNIDYYKIFNRLEFINYNKLGEENPIGLIDENYILSVSGKFFKKEILKDIIEYDEEPKEYNIQVYQLTKLTGNGSAYLQIDMGIHKITLHLKCKDNYQNTIFTHNMDETEPKLMQIKGIGKRVNRVVKQITFTYEH